MDKVFLRFMYALWMHHHGPKELAIGVDAKYMYYLVPEPGNRYDKNAIMIKLD